VYYVHLIESVSAPGERYVGMTTDLKQGLQEHNEGKSSHTAKSRPWNLITYIVFTHRLKAEASSVISNPGRATHSPIRAYGSACFDWRFAISGRRKCATIAANRIPSTAAHTTSDR
jgi:GIY-YIG catalytic domain